MGHAIPLVWQRAVPGGRRAEHMCLPWQLYLLIVLKGVPVSTALLQALVKVLMMLKVKGLVKGLVKAFVEAVPLFSLTSPPNPRTTPSTRPAGRCLGFWG